MEITKLDDNRVGSSALSFLAAVYALLAAAELPDDLRRRMDERLDENLAGAALTCLVMVNELLAMPEATDDLLRLGLETARKKLGV